jgi:hypothetical protein
MHLRLVALSSQGCQLRYDELIKLIYAGVLDTLNLFARLNNKPAIRLIVIKGIMIILGAAIVAVRLPDLCLR